MQCPQCQAENPDKAKFCQECGGKLSARCSQCGAELPPNVKFCSECGAKVTAFPLSTLPVPGPDPGVNLERLKRLVPKEYAERLLATRGKAEGERRMVTILFSDVKGSTAMGERLDPEEVMEVMNGAFDVLIGAVYKHEGTLARLMGDAILAFFGAPIAHENDPERAVRCALEIVGGAQAYAQKLEAERGIQGFNVRVGINTGLVVVGEVGSDLRVEYTAMGDAINLAARMEQNAPVGGVMISHDTFLQVQGIFDLQALEPISVKGKSQPVRVYRVERAKPRAFRRTAHLVAGVAVPMVGRESELKQLQEALRLAREGERQMVTVVGDPGVGKSRLLDEFDNWLDLLPEQIYSFKGRASLEAQSMPYALLRNLLAERCEIQENDPPETILDKLETGLRETLGAGKTIQMKAQFIGALVGFGLSSPELVSLKEQAQQIRDRGLMYLIEYFRAASDLRLVVILLEDLHWADDSSLDALQRLVLSTEGQRLLIVGMTRPGLLDRRPRWGEGQSFHTHLELRPLSRLGSRQLISEILCKVGQVPVSLRELVTSVAEGNPLYVEELVKMLIEERVILVSSLAEGAWQVDEARLAGLQVPPTLMGVLQARLDGLPAEERAALQCAAVVGRVFWDQALRYILQKEGGRPAPLEQTLAALRQHELVFHRESSAFADVQEYIFKHAVLREVAYESLLKRVRRSYHLQVAEWLIEVNRERAAEYAGLIGEHLELADEKERAFGYLKQAAQRAAARYANAEAVGYYTRALALLPASALESHWELLLGREQVLDLLARREAQRQDLDELEKLASGLQDPARQARVALNRAKYCLGTSDAPGSKEAAQAALKYAQAAHDPLLEAEALWVWGFGLWRLSRLQEGKSRAQAALSLVQTVEGQAARWLEAEVLRLLAVFMIDQETQQQCFQYLENSLRLCREFDNRRAEATVLNSLGVLATDNSEYDRARTYLEQSLRIAREIGSRADEYNPLANLGEVCLYQEDHLRSIFYYEQALPIAHETGNLGAEGQALITLGQLAMQQGDFRHALACFEQSLELMKRSGEPRYLSSIHYWFSMYYLVLGDYSRYEASQEQSKQYSLPRHWNARSIFDRGWLYLYQGNPSRARSSFKQRLADILISQEPSFEADVYASLGYACLRCNDPGQAAEAFQKAIEIRQKIKQNQGVAEAQAGLVAALADQRNWNQSQPDLANVLALLKNTEILWMSCPELAYLNCYKVLIAANPAAAKQVLHAAYQRLAKRAANIPNDELRQSYWQEVPWNYEIKSLWEARE